MDTVKVFVRIRVKEDAVSWIREELLSLVDLTLAEEGIIRYEVMEDIEEEGVFFVVQEWDHEEYHMVHMRSDHVKRLRDISLNCMLEWDVYRMKKIS